MCTMIIYIYDLQIYTLERENLLMKIRLPWILMDSEAALESWSLGSMRATTLRRHRLGRFSNVFFFGFLQLQTHGLVP